MTLRRHSVSIALAAAFLAFEVASPLEVLGGPVVSFAIGILTIWIVYSLVMLALRKANRNARAVRLAIWIPTVLLLSAAAGYRNGRAHEYAVSAAAAVAAHKEQTGALPRTLAEVALPTNRSGEDIRLRYLRFDDGKVTLSYQQPRFPMATERYDFRMQEWRRLYE